MSPDTVGIFAELLDVFTPWFKSCHDILVFVELGGNQGFFYIAVEATVAKCKVFHGTVAADTPWNGVLDVECRVGAYEIGKANFFTRIQTCMLLFYPKFVFTDIVFCGFDVTTCLLLVKLGNFFGIALAVFGTLVVEISNGSTHVGIVQFTRIFDMHFCLWIDDLLAQEHVDDLAYLMERAHGHGIAYGIRARTAQLVDAVGVV